ncbi:MAG: hypothetical protein WC683_12880 [bacterium]
MLRMFAFLDFPDIELPLNAGGVDGDQQVQKKDCQKGKEAGKESQAKGPCEKGREEIRKEDCEEDCEEIRGKKIPSQENREEEDNEKEGRRRIETCGQADDDRDPAGAP